MGYQSIQEPSALINSTGVSSHESIECVRSNVSDENVISVGTETPLSTVASDESLMILFKSRHMWQLTAVFFSLTGCGLMWKNALASIVTVLQHAPLDNDSMFL